ncbi:unnamed protein product [Cuscuta europaea]|uniref:THUMP domain-containing protein n=1 Tax=Cuscuta europaea TaxID=41803 RepID=A0A9P0Z650_CUSEU|nr:unnamed protein product [Cuscuta europaea]
MTEDRDEKSGNATAGSENDDGELGMKPWEQHSTVISIPRFDYNAPYSILRHSHCGFLITCPLKREKSATKEAICILEKYLPNADSKKRKLCIRSGDPDSLDCKESGCSNEMSGNSLETTKSDMYAEKNLDLSLVKLTRSGLLLLTFPFGKSPPIVNILFDIVQSLESHSLCIPRWCHRIFPIQGTCVLDEKGLQMIVPKLVNGFMIDNQNKLGQPVKFAVGYNRRGIEDSGMKNTHSDKNDHISTLLDRTKCFGVVAAIVKDIIPNSVVDLKYPEFAVLIELLPLSGTSDGLVVGGVSILPKELFSTKPRLSVKALVFDTKAKGVKRS